MNSFMLPNPAYMSLCRVLDKCELAEIRIYVTAPGVNHLIELPWKFNFLQNGCNFPSLDELEFCVFAWCGILKGFSGIVLIYTI